MKNKIAKKTKNSTKTYKVYRDVAIDIRGGYEDGVDLDFCVGPDVIYTRTFNSLKSIRACVVRSAIFDGAAVWTASRIAKGVPGRRIEGLHAIVNAMEIAEQFATKNSETIAEIIRNKFIAGHNLMKGVK